MRSADVARSDNGLKVAAWAVAWFLTIVVLVFLVIRLITDIPNLATGSLPPEGDFARRYAEHPVLAYLHILPGAVYLLGALAQLSIRVRTRSLALHRRLGRLVLAAGMLSGVMAVAVGLVMPFGGTVEAAASTVFGMYFLAALLLAYRAVLRRRFQVHRRWMIRAFVIAVGVGSIRIWVGLFEGLGLLSFEAGFGLGFWVAFVTHALAAELWLRWRPRGPVVRVGYHAAPRAGDA